MCVCLCAIVLAYLRMNWDIPLMAIFHVQSVQPKCFTAKFKVNNCQYPLDDMKVFHAERTFSLGGISSKSTYTNSRIQTYIKKAMHKYIISHIMCTKDRAPMHKEMTATSKQGRSTEQKVKMTHYLMFEDSLHLYTLFVMQTALESRLQTNVYHRKILHKMSSIDSRNGSLKFHFLACASGNCGLCEISWSENANSRNEHCVCVSVARNSFTNFRSLIYGAVNIHFMVVVASTFTVFQCFNCGTCQLIPHFSSFFFH